MYSAKAWSAEADQDVNGKGQTAGNPECRLGQRLSKRRFVIVAMAKQVDGQQDHYDYTKYHPVTCGHLKRYEVAAAVVGRNHGQNRMIEHGSSGSAFQKLHDDPIAKLSSTRRRH